MWSRRPRKKSRSRAVGFSAKRDEYAQIKSNWQQFVGKANRKWGRLTDDDWKVVEGKRDELLGKIQERYGNAREEAERQLAELDPV